MTDVRLMTLDPGHFHAALVHGEMYPEVAPRVDIFAPVGPDLVAHLHRLAAFNRRAARPTSWAWEVHAAPDFFDAHASRAPRQRGRSLGPEPRQDRTHPRVDRGRAPRPCRQAVGAQSSDLPQLEAALAKADARRPRRLRHHDRAVRSSRTILQRALVNDAATFGTDRSGDADAPARLHGERALLEEDGRGCARTSGRRGSSTPPSRAKG